MMPKKDKPKAEARPSENKDENILGVICYLLGVLALILYYVMKESKFIRFHAMQSALLSVVWFAVFIVLIGISFMLTIVTLPLGGIGGMVYLCVLPIGLVAIVTVVFGAWKAFEGEMYKMPVIGEYADRYS